MFYIRERGVCVIFFKEKNGVICKNNVMVLFFIWCYMDFLGWMDYWIG